MKFGLKSRIRVGFLLILIIFVGTLLFAVHQMDVSRGDLQLIQRGYLTMSRLATQVQTLQETQDEYVVRAFAETDLGFQKHLVRYAKNFYPRKLRAQLKALDSHCRAIMRRHLADDDQRFFEALKEQIDQVQSRHQVYDEVSTTILEQLEEGSIGTEAPLFQTYQQRSDELSTEIKSIGFSIENRIATAVSKTAANNRNATQIILWIALFTTLIGFITIMTVVRGFLPLGHLLESVRRIGRGSMDVMVEIDGPDEVGELAREFNTMAKALRERERTLAAQNEDLVRLKGFSDDVIRSVRIGIVVLNAEGLIRAANPAARSVFQMPLVEVEGRSLKELLPGQGHLQKLLAQLPTVVESGKEENFPLVEAGNRVLDIALVPIRDRAGSSSDDVLLLGEDVTSREQTRERLVESERLAAIGRLAAQITHEIRNPLSSVGLNIELLEDDIPFLPEARQEEASAIVAAVGKEVERLSHITEGYLRYARLPASQQIPGDVGDVVADLCAFYQSEAHQAGVMLEMQIEDQIPAVPHDAARLRQALLNLVRNASEAAGKGGTIRLVAKETQGDQGSKGVRLSVEDSGPGIPAEIKEHLFQPFFTTKKSGTGLGLTLTQEIVREHGASLSVHDSSLGGALFHIDLFP